MYLVQIQNSTSGLQDQDVSATTGQLYFMMVVKQIIGVEWLSNNIPEYIFGKIENLSTSWRCYQHDLVKTPTEFNWCTWYPETWFTYVE